MSKRITDSKAKLSAGTYGKMDDMLGKSHRIFDILDGYFDKADKDTRSYIEDTTGDSRSDHEEITNTKVMMMLTKGVYIEGVAPIIRLVADYATELQNKVAKTSVFATTKEKEVYEQHSKLYSNLAVGLVLKQMLENANELLEIINS